MGQVLEKSTNASNSNERNQWQCIQGPNHCLARPDKLWRVLVGSRDNRVGVAYLYKSKDFDHWTLVEEPLHSAEGTGMWECPDFFPIKTDGFEGLDTSARGKRVKYVLKNNLDVTKHDYYTIGTYDVVKDKYFPDKVMVEGDSGLR